MQAANCSAGNLTGFQPAWRGAGTWKQKQWARGLRGEPLTARGQRAPADASGTAFVRVRPLPAPGSSAQRTDPAKPAEPALQPGAVLCIACLHASLTDGLDSFSSVWPWLRDLCSLFPLQVLFPHHLHTGTHAPQPSPPSIVSSIRRREGTFCSNVDSSIPSSSRVSPRPVLVQTWRLQG